MAESKNGKTEDGAGAAEAQSQVQAQVVGQYVKDLSFENPNIEKLFGGSTEPPNLQVEVNVAAKRAGEDLFESAVELKAHATSKIGTIYDFECVYAGMFRIKNIPEQMLEPFLLINCPTILFPFLRRLVADVTREGGFPPLLLDPIDFGALFMRRQKERAAAASEAPKS
jgi:preprotein translocase subunit SecB